VVICRAGASTISELCMAGKACILVPSPNVAEDHQTKNAQSLVERGAAVLVPDRSSADEIFGAAIDILEHPEKKLGLEVSIAQLAKADAAEQIARLIVETAGQ